jgi:dienelactone hydrolase
VLVLAAGTRHDDLAREACARLARHDFVAWAPALPVETGAAPTDGERAAVDAAALQLFCEHGTDGARVGLVGFGRGALLALDAAARGARVAAVIGLDASIELATQAESLARLDAFVLAVFAEKDPAVAGGHVASLERRLRAESVPCELRVQPGVEQGFLDPARADRYDAVAARATWDKALARLRAEL